jgi:hypothetical protein
MFWNDDKKQMKEVEKQIAENQQLYKRVFDSEDGKAVLKDLEKRCFINHTTFSESPEQMAFNEGRRSIYMLIKNILDKDIKDILEELTK